MAAVIRLLAFVAGAIGVELARGAGLVTLACACMVGAMRLSPLLAVAAVAAGAVLSLMLPEDTASAGKVAHGLSNAPVLLLVHGAIGLVGLVIGWLLRRVRS